MGTDITMYLEQKRKNYDRYETIAKLYINRCYEVFNIIANVRNNKAIKIKYVSEPKGLPANLGVYPTYDKTKDDGHSQSWLNLAEIEKAISIAEKLPTNSAYLALQRIAHFMFGLNEPRIVFWFDIK